MEAMARAKYIKMSPRKVRRVIDLIKGKDVSASLAMLRFTPKAAARALEKVVRSAAANASQRPDVDADKLFVWRCWADEAPRTKRWRPRAMGRACPVIRRSCHITVVVRERE